MTFASLIAEAIQSLDLSKRTVAREVGITTKMLWTYESGNGTPNLTTALKLAAHLGISLDELKEGVTLPGDAPA